MKMKQILAALVSDESGQDLVEYALVVALISLGSVAAMGAMSSSISDAFSKVGSNLNGAV